jgi:hypothetical protein
LRKGNRKRKKGIERLRERERDERERERERGERGKEFFLTG